jgi:hypothetical protein
MLSNTAKQQQERMMIGTKEHYDLLVEFEKMFKSERLDKEEKSLWKKQIVYQDGQVNQKYQAFILGYSLGKCNFQ